MARVMVREAARTHADPTSLASAVARHIPEEGKRQQFIDATRAGSLVRPTASPGASGVTALPTAADAADPLADDFRAQVLQLVTRRMGPIARVIVKRAADAAGGSRARFLQGLLEALPEADRWTVQGEINKLG